MAQDLVVSPDDVIPVKSATPPPAQTPPDGSKPTDLVVSPDDVSPLRMTWAVVNGRRVRVPEDDPIPDPRVRTMDPTKHDAHIAASPYGGEKGESFMRGVRAAPANLGMMAGAATGAQFGLEAGAVLGPYGAATGAVLGGLAGGMIGAYSGETLETTLEGLWQKFHPGSGMNLTRSGAINRIAEAGQGAAWAEAAGPVAGAVAGRVAKGFSSVPQPWAKEAIETFKRPGGPETGSAVTPAEVSKSRLLGWLQRWVDGSMFSDWFGDMNPIPERQQMAEQRIMRVLDDLGQQQSAEELGRTVQGQLPPEPVAEAERRLEATEAQHETQQELRERAAKAAHGERETAAATEQTERDRAAEAAQTAREQAAETAQTERERAAETAQTERERAAEAAKEAREKTAATAQTAREQRGATARQTAAERGKDIAAKAGASTTTSRAGDFLKQVRERVLAAFRSEERQAWQAFEQATDQIPALTPRLDQFVTGLSAEKAGQILPDAGTTAAGKIASLEGKAKPLTSLQGQEIQVRGGKASVVPQKTVTPGLRKVLTELGKDPGKEPLTVAQFQQTIADLNRLQRALEKSAKTDPGKYNAQLGLVKKLNQLAHEDLVDVLGQLSSVEQDGTATPGSPLSLYRTASQLTKLGNDQLFNKQVMEIVRAAPEKIAEKLAVKNNSTAIRLVTQAVGDENMGPVRRIVLDNLLQADPVTGKINWPNVVKRIAKLGPDTTEALFPKGEHEALKRIAHGLIETEANLAAETATAAASLKAEHKAAADALAEQTRPAADQLKTETQTAAGQLKAETKTATAQTKAESQAAADRLKAAHATAAEDLETQTKASKARVDAAKAEAKAAKRLPDPVKVIREAEAKDVSAALFNKENLTTIRAVKRAVGEEGFKPLQRSAMDSLVVRDATTREVDWKQTLTRINGVNAEVLEEYFPGGHAADIRKTAELMVNLAKREGRGGSMGMSLGQYGVLMGILRFHVTTSAPVVILTPPTLARIFASPTALRWLTMGVQAKPWSVVARRSAAALTQFLYQENADAKQDEQERQAARAAQSPR